jgi:hypothetical protein
MSADRTIPRSIPDRVRAAYEQGRRASLVPHSCFTLALREWLKAHPGGDLMEAEAAVTALLRETAGSATTERRKVVGAE